MLISKILKKIVSGFYNSIENKRNQIIQKYILIAEQCRQATIELIPPEIIYINHQIKNDWMGMYVNIYKQIKNPRKYSLLKLPEDKIECINGFIKIFSDIDNVCKHNNQQFVELEKEKYKYIFENVEAHALDDQQQDCIVKDEVNNLVIAGAGSGKTTTIVGKVRYLLERYSYDPEKILVLSFTNASAKEISDRIEKETKKSIDAMTFHKLGLYIISEVEEAKPSLSPIELLEFVNEQFNELSKQPNYNDMLNKYFLSYLKPYRSSFDFKNEGDYLHYLKDADIRTLKNENVKSYEEMEIANFLLINNIRYDYEKKYEIETASKEHRQYVPDFYLPDYQIYIEHFGIDRKGNCPDFFTGEGRLSPKTTYKRAIEWKRQLHKDNNTTLIETYSYEKAEGVLTENLRKKLEDVGVQFSPLPRDEIWTLIENDKTNSITSFVNLIGTFITLLKSHNYDINTINEINKRFSNIHERKRNESFINLVVPIYDLYEEQLKRNGDIDFNDMINKATQYVQQNQFSKEYSYVIVDEFQDISQTRYKLIKAIRDKNNAKLFCVGDDWQSIYRFAGSDVDLFINFEKYFGFTQKSYIETTYRFKEKLIELSGEFIQKNESQIKKQLRSYKEDKSKAYELVYGNSTDELRTKLKQKFDYLPRNASVILIGRYKGDLKDYIDSEITSRYNYHNKKLMVYYARRKDINIQYMTIHKSKGLQADYVFIINNTNKKYGFPSQIEDDPILKLFSQNSENYPFAEERRLFYVALTRAKKFVYLMIENNSKSSFVREIEEDRLQKLIATGIYKICPKCKNGILKLVTGPYSVFYGCSNFPECKYKEKR